MATEMMVGFLGYSSEVANCAEEALEIFNPAQHALVMTDNRMPGMSGDELAGELKAKHPAISVVICSGWALDGVSNADVLLRKPYRIATIKETLSRLLPATDMTKARTAAH
jgi:CheY-like chemotaxis protein